MSEEYINPNNCYHFDGEFCDRCFTPEKNQIKYSIVNHILNLDAERKSLIYDFDKVKTENRTRFEEIQKELTEIEVRYING